MTQDQAFNTAEKLLLHIYGEEPMICARIGTASADKDKVYMSCCLDVIINFCNKLKEAMEE